MPPARFEPAIAANERPQTHALDRAATGIRYHSLMQLRTTRLIFDFKCHLTINGRASRHATGSTMNLRGCGRDRGDLIRSIVLTFAWRNSRKCKKCHSTFFIVAPCIFRGSLNLLHTNEYASARNVIQLFLLLHRAFLEVHLIYYTPTNALLYYNSLKSLH